MLDHHVHLPPVIKHEKSRASVWAALSLLASVSIAYWSNYAARRDQHDVQAAKCRGLSDSLMTTAVLIIENLDSAQQSIQAPIPLGKSTNVFILPPLDNVIGANEASLDILSHEQEDSILRVEYFYRTLRDDLANTTTTYHEGDTFGVKYKNDALAYAGAAAKIDQQSRAAIALLADRKHCNSLADTSVFWPSRHGY